MGQAIGVAELVMEDAVARVAASGIATTEPAALSHVERTEELGFALQAIGFLERSGGLDREIDDVEAAAIRTCDDPAGADDHRVESHRYGESAPDQALNRNVRRHFARETGQQARRRVAPHQERHLDDLMMDAARDRKLLLWARCGRRHPRGSRARARARSHSAGRETVKLVELLGSAGFELGRVAGPDRQYEPTSAPFLRPTTRTCGALPLPITSTSSSAGRWLTSLNFGKSPASSLIGTRGCPLSLRS